MSKAVNHDDIDLMRYADGEIDEHSDDAAAIASLLDGDGDGDDGAGRKIAMLEQLSEVVRTRLELAADDAEPRLDAMWATIERRIQANGAVESAPAARRAEPAETGGLWAAIGRFFEQYRGHFVTAAVAAGAAAALIFLLRPPAEVASDRPVAVSGQGSDQGSDLGSGSGKGQGAGQGVAAAGNGAGQVNDSGSTQVKLVNDEPSPPEIEQLEVTGGSGTVFVMPRDGEDDVEATVIFLDTDDVEGPL